MMVLTCSTKSSGFSSVLLEWCERWRDEPECRDILNVCAKEVAEPSRESTVKRPVKSRKTIMTLCEDRAEDFCPSEQCGEAMATFIARTCLR
jgi:hypothetical protein